MKWLVALATLPIAYILTALLTGNMDRWLTERRMILVTAFGVAVALSIAYVFETTH